MQSSLFDSYRRRVVVPLVRRSNLGPAASLLDLPLNPCFMVEGVEVVLHPLEIVSIGSELLGEKVGALAQEGERISNALDELLTRAWT